MSSSESVSASLSAPVKPRIRITMPKSNAKPALPTPAGRQNNLNEISPTPLRGGATNNKDGKPSAVATSFSQTQIADPTELSPRVISGLKHGDLEFPINEECTSLKIIPNGRLIVAGFSDGTLRLFDLAADPASHSPHHNESYSSSSEDELSFETAANKNAMVCSKSFQRFGAVACQIHARGVHTSLIMHVDCSEDSLYCFGGVLRGSMELVAVDLSNIVSPNNNNNNNKKDLLDLIQVHRHSDAKLKGFGACTRLKGPEQKYLLLTGRGIKNIHIWSFAPNEKNAWQCLYDTQTNGNTIGILHLRYDPNGLLQALSKSDSQKLRVWDLSHEQHGGNESHPLYSKKSTIQQLANKSTCSKERPRRPPYVDVANTETALGISGAFSFGGTDQVSVVSLDVENVGSPYNRTEMALPGCGSSRRRQRGDLQTIVRVAGMPKDAGHVLLELSNGSIVHYSSDPKKSASRLQSFSAFQWEEGSSRNISLERIGASGLVVAAMSMYYATSGRGSIVLRSVDADGAALQNTSPLGDKSALAAATVNEEVTSPNQSIQLFGTTPTVAKKKKKKRRVGEDTPQVLAQTKKPAVARVSLDSNAGEDPSTMVTGEGVAVSPEQQMELSNEPKQKSKKKGAMTKYLRPADADKQSSKEAAPRRLHQEIGAAKPKKANDSDRVKAKTLKPAIKTPLKDKPQNEPGKSGRKEENASNRSTRKSAEKAKQKRVKSPCVPRKRQFQSSASSLSASKRTSKEDSLLEVAEVLCDIRRGTPSPKRARPNTGRYTRSTTPVPEPRPNHPHRKRPPALASQLPTTSVLERVGAFGSYKNDTDSLQQASRMKLALEHRAGHEMLRKRVLLTVDTIVRSLSRSDPISDSEARTWFDEEIHSFKEMLEDMMGRQTMEASALFAGQSAQQKEAPELQVSFPFPDLFDSVSSAFDRFMLEEKTST